MDGVLESCVGLSFVLSFTSHRTSGQLLNLSDLNIVICKTESVIVSCRIK